LAVEEFLKWKSWNKILKSQLNPCLNHSNHLKGSRKGLWPVPKTFSMK
jgi:hypothetical protein